ncbi:MFS transporter [Actinophytocola sp.]|uniref:MFS transporter n=1 Tax=Actinophytocola sp. TaxID=1872138 RepID=UPI003D6A8907
MTPSLESQDNARAAVLLERVEKTPVGRPQRRIATQTGLGYTYEGLDAATVSIILPAATAVFGLTGAETGLLGSSVLIGFMVGSLIGGGLSDSYGRRAVLMLALAVFAFGSLLGAVAPTWEFLFVARVITGVGCGAEVVVAAVYVSEMIATRNRETYVSAVVVFVSAGWCIAALLGVIFGEVDGGFRYIQFAGALPVFALLIWRRVLPESPRWLLAKGRIDEAENVVDYLEGTARSFKRLPRDQRVRTGASGAVFANALRSYADAFGRTLIRHTLLGAFTWFIIFFCFYGFFTWIPSLLIKEGYAVAASFMFTLLINLAQIPGYASASFLLRRFEPKRLLAAYFVLGAMSAAGMAYAVNAAMILVFGCLMAFFMSGLTGANYAYTPQFFRTRSRNSGAAAASALGRSGSILAPIIIGVFFDNIGFAGVFFMLMAVMLLGAVGLGLFGPRVKNKSHELLEAERTGTVDALGGAAVDPAAPAVLDRAVAPTAEPKSPSPVEQP